jgi:hypothetical protein
MSTLTALHTYLHPVPSEEGSTPMEIPPHYQRWQVLYPAHHSIPGDSTHGEPPSSDDDTVTGQVWHGAGIPIQIQKVTKYIVILLT